MKKTDTSKQTYRICFCFRRRFRVKEAEVPADIQALFENYSENGLMDVEHLYRFLKEVQGEDKLTREEAETVMESFLNQHKHLNIFQRRSLYIKEFFRYLLSENNSPLSCPPKVHHDMTAPLSHYFIYTGHNSYLTGNQISSDCSEVPIVEALKRGVRVIELDMWPNSTKEDVDIMHGGFTQRNLMRVYPKGTRIDSSNYNPLIGWMHGAQMVAFNMQIGIAGVPYDSAMKRTKTIEDNWLPAWNEEFEFPLTVPELALLRIEVHEFDMSDKDDFGGQTCLPVSELKTGIRAVPLHDYKGDKYKSVKLLLRFDFV
ncbi:UNVERIFIED_CONTAM: Phosphoinositide phospholipase C 2 [Sesamum radiatum]|uniref:Phosphoinositide phospholipase C n=1 Tax=Sesamum radiatum TaxID=300843 RepID=A0AAW2LDX2_SESRA